MTASGGLQSDASRAVYSEDVVTYVDASDASEWADRALGDGPVGLVSAVAGESDEDDGWESDDSRDGPREVRARERSGPVRTAATRDEGRRLRARSASSRARPRRVSPFFFPQI